MRYTNRWCRFVVVLLSALTGGCVTKQSSDFRGTLTHEGASAASTAVPIAGQFHYRDNDVPDAITGFTLGESNGILLFIHDRAKFVSNGFRVANDAVSAVYLADWTLGKGEPWKTFVRLDESARDRSQDAQRLNGSFDIERWNSNIDFRVRLAMQSAGPRPSKVEGVLTTNERQEFRPAQWSAMTLWSFGLVRPTGPAPPK